MNVLCVIPARGGSKGVKDKNIKPLLGKPLIGYTIEAALDSRLCNKVVVSTDDEKIARAACKYKIKVIKRPKEFATDFAPIELALRHSVERLMIEEGYAADILVWLQANNPVRKKGQIDNVVKRLIRSGAQSAVTIYAVDQFPQWMKKMDKKGLLQPVYPDIREYRRQDTSPLYLLDGSVVAIKTLTLMGTKNLKGAHVYLGKKTLGILQDKKYSVEIHDEEDFDIARFYLSGEKL